MSRLTDLIRQLHVVDPQLGADLESEIRALTKRRSFGLVFERHQPEAVELPGIAPKRGSKVRILEPRGSNKKGDNRLWLVESITNDAGVKTARLLELYAETPEQEDASVDDLVVVAEFKDGIFPGLVETGRVERGGDKPFHTVINAENFHALEMLTYTHRGSIDAIYIDPPYNTGAKDWKYNNDYVEGDDAYRHSKWLAMMERRLLVAKELLNPDDSVLIVTIDEKEYLRLGLLVEQTFPEARVQMVSTVINPKGTARTNEFSRVDEFIYFVMIGDYQLTRTGNDMLTSKDLSQDKSVRWRGFSRTGRKGLRPVNPGSWYPLYFNESDDSFHSVGETVLSGESAPPPPKGTYAVWPPVRNGEEYSWAMIPSTFKKLHSIGAIRFGRAKKGKGASVSYLTNNQLRAIDSGIIKVIGQDENGAIVVEFSDDAKTTAPKTQWNQTSHEAGSHGTNIVGALLPTRRFPFPKSLYAVEDALRFFVASKPNAVILDFFSGSGTTAHSVMRLNRQDGGRRQCISVTNNEVAADEQRKLRKQGLRPGDREWEANGICDYITKPRVMAAITGKTPDGVPVKGDYKFRDEFPMSEGFEENAAFFTLTYESPLAVRHNRAFERIAPMLWLRAGAQGRIIESLSEHGWDVSDVYGVLENFNQSAEFFTALGDASDVRMVFFVTDDDAVFQMACRRLPEGVEPVRLYSSYLQNFEINRGRA